MKPVLIVEDHPLVAEATGKLLSHYGDDISPVICSNATQAIAKLDDKNADWFRIFLDLDVPGAYGLSLAREVQRRGLAGRCCVISAFEKRDYIDEIRQSGFLGYIVKAVPSAEFTASAMRILDAKSSFPSIPPGRRPRTLRLTRRQTQLLELIRLGLSSREIAAELQITDGTVNNHVAAILQVFEAGTRAQAVARAIELGLLEMHPRAGALGPRRRLVPDEDR